MRLAPAQQRVLNAIGDEEEVLRQSVVPVLHSLVGKGLVEITLTDNGRRHLKGTV